MSNALLPVWQAMGMVDLLASYLLQHTQLGQCASCAAPMSFRPVRNRVTRLEIAGSKHTFPFSRTSTFHALLLKQSEGGSPLKVETRN